MGEDIYCETCGAKKNYYDHVKRIVRIDYGQKRQIDISRYRCPNCKTTKRHIPPDLLPKKQYHKRIINGFQNGELNTMMPQFEDFPSESTISRWTL